MNNIERQELSLAKMYPALARQFHPTLNGFVRPIDVSYNNRSKQYWWICEKGHEWQNRVSDRIFKSSCPKCELYSNSLAKKYPSLLEEWDYEGNSEINPKEIPFDNRSKRCRWKCPEGHKYTATVRSRTLAKEGCPDCPKIEKLMVDEYPDIVPYWAEESNAEKKENIPAASKMIYNWKCNCGRNFQANIRKMTKGVTCKNCLLQKNSLQKMYPELSKEWSPGGNRRTPDEIMFNSTKKYWWQCEKHKIRWQQSPLDRIETKTGCPVCDIEKSSLERAYPQLAAEWDYEKNPSDHTPENVTPNNYTQRAWWKCVGGHSWGATVKNRVSRKMNCPDCERENKNLADSISSDLYAEWVPYLNGNKMPEEISAADSHLSYWWMCKERGHLELETANARKRKDHCIKCEEEKMSLAFNAPIEILNEWDTSKNTETPLDVYYKSTKSYWWLDKMGNSYCCSPQIRMSNYLNKNS